MKFEDKLYPTNLLCTLEDFRSSDDFCDVVLVVDGYEFRAHKLILSAASPYFRAMFNSKSSFVESKQDKVNLHGIDRIALSEILRFIYSSDIEITDDNVYVLMEAANLFQIYALRRFIDFYLQCSLTIENCLYLYLMAKLYHYHDLAANAFRFLVLNFSKTIKKVEFSCVPFEVLSEIVSSKLLDVLNEEELFEVIIKWVTEDVQNRDQYLEPLISKVNLNLIPIESLSKLVNKDFVTGNIVKQIKEIIAERNIKSLVFGMIDYEERYNFHKYRHKAEQTVVFAIGGETSGIASHNVECFTQGFSSWSYVVPVYLIAMQETQESKVLPPLRCARYHAAYAQDAYNVYVIGGRNSTTFLDKCEVFDIRKNNWNYLQRLPEPLCAGGAVLLDGKLIVVGGCNKNGISNRVWKLNSARKAWTVMPPLSSPRYFHGTIVSGGYIYVLGGYDRKIDIPLDTCMKFDPSSNKWFKISGMREARAKFGCAAVGNFIYVFGGISDGNDCLKSVEMYNTFTDEWSYLTSMLIPRHSFSVAVAEADQEIYCLGGSDSIHFLDSVHKFSLRTKRWYTMHSLKVSRLAPAAAALSVPYFAVPDLDTKTIHL